MFTKTKKLKNMLYIFSIMASVTFPSGSKGMTEPEDRKDFSACNRKHFGTSKGQKELQKFSHNKKIPSKFTLSEKEEQVIDDEKVNKARDKQVKDLI